ncbi:MAG: peroxide stress protein YaaA [Gelidibacter sp.]
MKLVLSPAKSLDFESKLPTSKTSEAQFLSSSERINNLLKKKSEKSLSKLMNISDALGQLNYERNQEWKLPFDKGNARPAIYAFSGDVYRALDAYSIPTDKLDEVEFYLGCMVLLKPLVDSADRKWEPNFQWVNTKTCMNSGKENIVKALNAGSKKGSCFEFSQQLGISVSDTKSLKVR